MSSIAPTLAISNKSPASDTPKHRPAWVDETGAAEISIGTILVARDGRSTPPDKPQGWTASTLAAAEVILASEEPGPITATYVAATAGLSIGAATKALRLLMDEGHIAASATRGPRSARRIANRDRLLAAYADAADALRRHLSLQVAVLGRDLAAEIMKIGEVWDRQDMASAATGTLAADTLAPFLTASGTAVVYVDASTIAELEHVARIAQLDPIDGGRLTLAPFPTSASRTLSREVDGLMVAPWPRVYADLRTVGVRGEEAAEHLKEVIDRGR